MSFVKLHDCLLVSSVWDEPDDVRIVWITMLAMADRDGVVRAKVPGIAHQARKSREATAEALAVLMAPDKFSKCQDHEGRRVLEVDGGYLLVTHGHYRRLASAEQTREKTAERVRKHRAKKAGNAPVTVCNASNAIAEAEAEEEIPPISPPEGDTPKRKRKKPVGPMPSDWEPRNDEVALGNGLRLDPLEEADDFRDWTAAAGKHYADWDRAFASHLRRQSKRRGKTPGDRAETAHEVRRAEQARQYREAQERREREQWERERASPVDAAAAARDALKQMEGRT